MHLLTRWLDILGRLGRPESPEESFPYDPLAPTG
jgi:hypothetical protein